MGRPTMPDPAILNGRIEGTLLTYIKYDHTPTQRTVNTQFLSVSVGPETSHPAVTWHDPQDHQELWLSEEDTNS